MGTMLWELLVTDGHVRAARLRYLAPLGILGGVLLITMGWLVLIEAPPSQAFYSSSEYALIQRADQVRQPVLGTFAQVPGLYVQSTEIPQLVPESELPKIFDAVNGGVATGSFPPAMSVSQAKSAAEFWSWNWPRDKLISLDRGDLRAFGAIVFPKAQPGQADLNPVRWLAVYRKFPSGWENVAIKATGFIAPPGEKTAVPADIPISLRKLMDMPDYTP